MAAYLPMLAHKINEKMKYVKFPGFVQPKLDGMRCVKADDYPEFYTRTGKDLLSVPKLEDLVQKYFRGFSTDGELYVHNVDFEDIMGSVRRTVNICEDERVQYWIYDIYIPQTTFKQRTKILDGTYSFIPKRDRARIVKVFTTPVYNMDEVEQWMDKFVSMGYEGLMFRNAESLYTPDKRSTDLLKMKRWHDIEVMAKGFLEGAGKHKGRLGAVRCVFIKKGKEYSVKVGGGFTDAQRDYIWNNQSDFIFKEMTIKYQNLTKAGVPRFPEFLRWREPE
jgi:DNA ligase-1